ncbi:acetyltransferase [Paenibacillus sedimenti]|uniref:Acetyltransferase n=1 Tax=Paenibacillus sedimenti TaxID=2770274 RepID=A0A926QIT4_9BACL|nr:acetyltransferase [Paenibacillus sedimenti]MBD0379948.1 acetyltransferase [Paenibacillus sedimenti]
MEYTATLYIIGAGSLGIMTLDILLACKFQEPIAFIDNNEQMIGQSRYGVPILGPMDTVLSQKGISENSKFIIAIANNAIRQQTFKKYNHFIYMNAIHPKSVISPFASLGYGNIILPGVVIDPEVKIGNHVIINKSVSIGHNTVLSDFSQVAHGVSIGGYSCLKERVFIGLGAALLPSVTIGKNSVVGAGAVVTRDVAENCTVVGVPAKPMNFVKGDG